MISLSPIVYIQLSPDRLSVRDVRTGETVSEIPEVAITLGEKRRIAAVGSEAARYKGKPDVLVINPFAHPRSLVSDFTIGEQALRAFLGRVAGRRMLALSPKVIMHPLGDPPGGFTQVECRAFREMAIGAGASKVVLWKGRPLTDDEILNGRFGPEDFEP